MADACLRDSEGRFLFLSVYGRDTALMQFMSALSLPVHQQGLSSFHLVEEGGPNSGRAHFCDVGGFDRLTKHSGRMPKQNLFGPLSQLWIYDKALQAPDLVNRIGWVLQTPRTQDSLDPADATHNLRALGWQLMKRLSPVALLDTWQVEVMGWALEAGIVRELNEPRFPPLGPVRGLRVGLGQGFVTKISLLVRQGFLTLPAPAVATAAARPQKPLRAAPTERQALTA